jgi:hypothetical protein
MKNIKPFLITAGFFLASLGVMLEVEPHEIIKSSPLLVRVITLVWAVILAVGSYSKWTALGTAISELVADLMSIPADIKASVKKEGNTARNYMNTAPLLLWTLCWVVGSQIMASFYIADWCY